MKHKYGVIPFFVLLIAIGLVSWYPAFRKTPVERTPSTPIAKELEGLWLNYSSAYFGFSEVQIYNSETSQWLWVAKGYPDPWDLQPDIAERGIQFGNVKGQGRFIEAMNQNAGNTQYNITYKDGSVVQEGMKLTLYVWNSKIATRSSATGGSATLEGDKKMITYTYAIEDDNTGQTGPRKKLILRNANGAEIVLFNRS